jgi:hypothetical protein
LNTATIALSDARVYRERLITRSDDGYISDLSRYPLRVRRCLDCFRPRDNGQPLTIPTL